MAYTMMAEIAQYLQLPEAEGKITKALLLGCALAEGTAIFGMVVAILIILFLG